MLKVAREKEVTYKVKLSTTEDASAGKWEH